MNGACVIGETDESIVVSRISQISFLLHLL